ncbi:MAG: MCE family protein [bacterium]|nr:MCE family protein [bacterium]
MTDHRRNVLVGAFMVAGLGALGVLMVLFGEAPEWLGGAEWELDIKVRQLRGASQGTPVNLNGVQIGRVDKLRFEHPERPDLGVTIVALIKDDYMVPRGAKAVIYGPVLGFGRGQIQIEVPPDGGGDPLPLEDAEIYGEVGSVFHELMPDTMMNSVERTVLQIGNFAGALTPVADDLHQLFKITPVEMVDDPVEARRLTANLHTAIQRFDMVLKHFNDVLGDPEVKSALREGILNLHQMTEDGKLAVADIRDTAETVKDSSVRITAKVEQGIDQATADFSKLSRKTMPVLDHLAQASANLNQVSLDLAEGEGTAGKLLRDDRLYEGMVLLVRRVTEAVDTIGRIAAKSERQGYIDVAENKRLPGTKIPAKLKLYDPATATTATERNPK